MPNLYLRHLCNIPEVCTVPLNDEPMQRQSTLMSNRKKLLISDDHVYKHASQAASALLVYEHDTCRTPHRSVPLRSRCHCLSQPLILLESLCRVTRGVTDAQALCMVRGDQPLRVAVSIVILIFMGRMTKGMSQQTSHRNPANTRSQRCTSWVNYLGVEQIEVENKL